MSSNWIAFLNRDLIALTIVLLFSLILLFSNDSPYIDAIESDISDGYYLLTYPKRWYRDILSAKEQNSLLAKKIVQLKLLYSENEHYKFENEHLRKMLNFANKSPLSLFPANITNRYSSIVQSLVLDVGAINDITKNSPVIDMEGLVGKTVSIGEFASKVQLISDKNFRVSVRVGKQKSLGIFAPTHGKYGVLEGVGKSVDLKIGDIAYTSGISDIYPGNIPVAEVIATSTNNKRPFQAISVKIMANFDDLNYLFIVQ